MKAKILALAERRAADGASAISSLDSDRNNSVSKPQRLIAGLTLEQDLPFDLGQVAAREPYQLCEHLMELFFSHQPAKTSRKD
ncbi:MAG: hypothetical protein ACREQ4_05945 [Candidatus Binataceae bacterium]